MREIKFRAWDKAKKELKPVSAIWFDTAGINRILNNPREDWLDSPDVQIMQYTGLKDKNGVEIYEGDRVQYDRKEYGSSERDRCKAIIEWQEFNSRFIGNRQGYAENIGMDWVSKFCEVIGNIYEPPPDAPEST